MLDGQCTDSDTQALVPESGTGRTTDQLIRRRCHGGTHVEIYPTRTRTRTSARVGTADYPSPTAPELVRQQLHRYPCEDAGGREHKRNEAHVQVTKDLE